MARVLLGVAGGIAAYKACEVLRGLTEGGHDVRVVPTESALQFVGEPTWAALSGHRVSADPMRDAHEVPHVRLGQEADLVVVVPATANLLAKAASGLADDLLTNVLLTARCPVVMAPAMHTEMWEHPATVENVKALRERGVLIVEPAVGRLTGPDSGRGRLPEPAAIVELRRRAGQRRTLDHTDGAILPAAEWWSQQVALANHSTPCGSWVIGAAGDRGTPSLPQPSLAVRRSTWYRRTSSWPTPQVPTSFRSRPPPS